MDSAGGLRQVRVTHDCSDTDLRGGDHLDVHARVAQGLGKVRGHSRVRLHTSANQGNLAHVIVVDHVAPALALLQLAQQVHAARAVRNGQREGDVRLLFLQGGDILQHHVDVDLRVRQRTEELRRLTRGVRDTQDGDLRLRIVGSYSGQDCFFHGDILQCSGNQRAGVVTVRRANSHRYVERASVFHTAQHQDLRPRCGQLQHLLEAELVQLARIGHNARIRGVDAVHVRVDLALVGIHRRRERHRRGVRATAAQRGDVARIAVHTLEARDNGDLARIHGLLDAARRDVNNARVAVALGGDHACLRAGKGLHVHAVGSHRHGHQRV